MTNYESPVILRTEELAEGVYLASGCYTASAYIHQTPQSGSGEYRIQVNGQHSADHTKEAQWHVCIRVCSGDCGGAFKSNRHRNGV